MKQIVIAAAAVTFMACGNAGNTNNKDSVTTTGDTTATTAPSADNTLTADETAQGWKLLFNGSSLDGWRVYKDRTSNTWSADSGTMHCKGSSTDKSDLRGDLITTGEYGNFEFEADWKLAPQGNSGILYLVTEEFDAPYLSGPEYQIIDDNNFPEKLEDWQKTGANYAMNPPLVMAAKPIGEWNHTKIVVNKGHVEHWLNGQKTAETEMWSDDWNKAKATGKWKDAKGYGMAKKGHIALQDHGSEIWFKNVKIKEL
ncbi:DUF1080 domain-containing protein [Chitinophaga sedimenti]|uniref:3-keto-disaccharide hydrolase n=1 Tax=Chitinophaga sedimenti TaxID=2033606 RepID=UPI002002ED6F|nr:DUF1080 domain-containing protein [Chitinophaga sedimenti]MCK7558141.1 DUF1080 domain-containing protein [Chitinophaga sedimenti]